MERPPGLAYWLDGQPSYRAAFGLALQHLAIQSVLLVIPVAAAGMVSRDAAEMTRFVCLSILASALWQALQVLTRGPVGSGYPIPATHTAALLGAYLLTSRSGGGFAAVGAMVCLTGVASTALTFLMQRLRVVLPNEVAGVVVFLIGVSLIGVATQQMGLQPGSAPRDALSVWVVITCMLVMAVLALSKTKASPFAVLVGALAGVVLSLVLGEGDPHAAEVLAGRPWVALPEPWAPDFGAITVAPMAAYVLALVAIQATSAGSMVVIQRAADAGWTRPDAPPLRRGLLANGLAITMAGLIGGAAPGPATAGVGLSVATGTLARRIVWCGVPLLVVLALCPKFVALFVLMPAPVKAAMLLYVSGFIMAQGCQLATARLLDTRRTMIVAFGLTAGVMVALAPVPFLATVPAIASPLSFGAIVAFLLNLLTLPLVSLRAKRSLALDLYSGRTASEWFAEIAATWGLKPSTARVAEQALSELAELLHARGVEALELTSARSEDRVELSLAWDGRPLPERTNTPNPLDLLGTSDAQERFAVFMATRGVQRFTQRTSARGCEVRLILED
jgi:NCS2 family nucleobase:cation symporter-2